jgi:DNA-binding LytR/AlgR family response regulator
MANKQVTPKVVFLSGRADKCTSHLESILDAHLQPPYRASRLAKAFKKLSGPDFTPQPLDFFFLKTHARYTPIRYEDLVQVERRRRDLLIETRQTEYRITSTLAAFQNRLPIPLSRVRRGKLINEQYNYHDHVPHL